MIIFIVYPVWPKKQKCTHEKEVLFYKENTFQKALLNWIKNEACVKKKNFHAEVSQGTLADDLIRCFSYDTGSISFRSGLD